MENFPLESNCVPRQVKVKGCMTKSASQVNSPLITNQKDDVPGYDQVNNFELAAAATDQDVQVPLERTTQRSLRVITKAKSNWDDAETKLKAEAPKCDNCKGHLLSKGYIADQSIADQLVQKEKIYTKDYKE